MKNKIHPLKDISSRKDIELLVRTFYDKVNLDPVIGYIFNDIAKINWERHIPVMCDFWENTILYTGAYEGNPMDLHKHLHRVMPLQSEHFAHWNQIFVETVDELFSGANAANAKQRAISISAVLEKEIMKLSEGNH